MTGSASTPLGTEKLDTQRPGFMPASAANGCVILLPDRNPIVLSPVSNQELLVGNKPVASGFETISGVTKGKAMFTLEIAGRPIAVTNADEEQARELFMSED